MLYENDESRNSTPETNKILYVNYTEFKFKKLIMTLIIQWVVVDNMFPYKLLQGIISTERKAG